VATIPGPAGAGTGVTTRVAATAVIAAILVVATVAAWSFRDEPDEAAAAGDPERGAELFLSKGCGACHDGPGHVGSADMGPDLSTLASRATEAYVRQSVRDPDAIVVANNFSGPGGDGSPMPLIPMDDAALDAIVAYLLAGAA
jgi:mono/diheme cytochrome c family protein